MCKLNINVEIGNNKKYIEEISEILEPYKITIRDQKALGESLSKIITANKYITLERV
jgi:hypothetical protein